MASYSIRWKRSAEKELRGLHRRAIPGVLAAVEALAENPFPDGCPLCQDRSRLPLADLWGTGGLIELGLVGRRGAPGRSPLGGWTAVIGRGRKLQASLEPRAGPCRRRFGS